MTYGVDRVAMVGARKGFGMDTQKLNEVLADEAFVKELLLMQKPEQVQEALEDRGVELSLDEIEKMGAFIRKVQTGEISKEQVQKMADGELSEDEMEQVSGGSYALAGGLGGALGVITAVTAILLGW